MLTEMETLLRVRTDATTVVDETTEGARLTAGTRETFDSAAEATTAAYDLLRQVLGLGYGLRGGMVGAEATYAGSRRWRGELVEVWLDLAPAA